MGILNKLLSNYGDDLAEAAGKTAANYTDDFVSRWGKQIAEAGANKSDDAARVAANKADDAARVFYHGTPSGGFTEFRDGAYFTPNKAYADTYQNPLASDISFGKTADNPMTYEVLLKNKAPFDITSSPEARKIYIDDYIKGGNATGINPYLSQAEYDAIQDIDWTEVEALRDFLQENGYNYDSIVADEGKHFDEAGNLIPRGRSTMVFNGKDVEILPQTMSVLSKLLKK